jgi:DNA polymerase I-like protein with 3'-5' exonuclease and polymerase domains
MSASRRISSRPEGISAGDAETSPASNRDDDGLSRRRRFAALRRFRDRVAREQRLSLWGRPLPRENVPDHIALNHVIQASGRDVFCDGLLALEDLGLDEHLLLPLHDEYVLQLPAGDATETARAITDAVSARIGDVELPVESTIGARSWASVGAAA